MTVRVAAAGDIHCSEEERGRLETAFMDAERESDLILLAGDLTTYGEPEQAAVLADVARGTGVPVYGVLGNHDWHANRHEELVSALRGGGIHVLERAGEVVSVNGMEVGIVGTKGFIGGFTGSLLPDFGEPLLRRVYAETSAEVSALDRGLRRVRDCAIRIVLLHYAPTKTTIEGEPETIWTYLGSERLAEPIVEHRPDLVLHGHGHRGTFAGAIDGVPVFNVGVPVIGRDFWVFELDESGLMREPEAVGSGR
jgi:uncharacterized protein